MAPYFVKQNSNSPGRKMVLSSINIFLGHGAEINWTEIGSWTTEDSCPKAAPHQRDPSATLPSELPPSLAAFWSLSSFILQAGPRRSGFHYCLWRKVRAIPAEHWKQPRQALERKHVHVFFFLGPPFWDRDQEKVRFLSFASPAMPLFVKLMAMLFIDFLSLSQYESSHSEYPQVLL